MEYQASKDEKGMQPQVGQGNKLSTAALLPGQAI